MIPARPIYGALAEHYLRKWNWRRQLESMSVCVSPAVGNEKRKEGNSLDPWALQVYLRLR